MAFLDLYMDAASGNDFNSGTSTGAPITVSGATTSLPSISGVGYVLRVTAASGTPFSGVSAGQWASVWTSAQTVSSAFIGMIYAVNGGGVSIDIYTETSVPNTNCLGYGDSINGSGLGQFGSGNTVNVNIGGPFASLNILTLSSNVSGAIPRATNSNNLRINVKAATYANSVPRTFPPGTAARPIYWRGYYANPGDIDNCPNVNGVLVGGPTGATRPLFSSTSTTTAFTVSAWNWLENLDFSAPPTGGSSVIYCSATSGAYIRLVRCRVTATTNSVNSLAINCIYGSTVHAVGCKFEYTGTGSSSAAMYLSGIVVIFGCTIRGGTIAMQFLGQGFVCAFNVIETSGAGLSYQGTNSSSTVFLNNVIYNCTTGISVLSAATGHILASNNLIANCGAGINYASTVNAWTFQSINNGFSTVSGSQATGLFESYQRGAITEPSGVSPFVDRANHDFGLIASASSRQAGFPGQYEV